MSLEQKVMADLKTAMLAKDEKSLRSLRAIKAAIINLRTAEGFSGEIKEDDEIRLVQKLPQYNMTEQENFLKDHILLYFEGMGDLFPEFQNL